MINVNVYKYPLILTWKFYLNGNRDAGQKFEIPSGEKFPCFSPGNDVNFTGTNNKITQDNDLIDNSILILVLKYIYIFL